MRLITGPFVELHKSKINDILLGHWCDYENNQNKRINKYHWQNRNKFKKDFNYLNSITLKLNQELAKSLNRIHNTSFSNEFWFLIINPWLSMFLSGVYDKWETLKTSINSQKITEIVFLNLKKNPAPKDFNNYLDFYNDHYWNHNVFKDIFKFYKKKNIKITFENIKKNNFFKEKKLKKNFFKLLLDKFFSILPIKNQVVFIDNYFSLINFFKISIAIKQLPRIYSEFYKTFSYPKVNSYLRSKVNLKLGSSQFEKFISSYIPKNLPVSFLEGFSILINYSKKIKINSNLIITGNANFPTEVCRFWCALKKENKATLILNEHGGSIPTKFRYYNIFDKIFKNQISWSKPLLKNHIKLTPSKLINLKNLRTNNKYISIITLETSQYAYYCQNLQSSLILNDFEQKKKLIDILKKNNLDFRIKPYKDMGWHLEERYKKLYGSEKILNMSVKSAIKNSKLLICTYPETTFLESMISGVPTVLLYLKDIWIFKKEFSKIVNLLIKNNIIFYEPEKAAKHIIKISKNTNSWWNQENILKVRKIFHKECGDVSREWLQEWKKFILKKND